MSHVLSITAAVWLLCMAAPLLAGDTVAEALSQAGVPAAGAQPIIERSAALGDAGILATPVINKVREGVAKDVPPDDIAAAALKLADRMHVAAGLYPGAADPAAKTTAVEAAAKAMIAGSLPGAVREVFAALAASKLPRAEWHRPFGAMGGLVASGAGADRARAIVTGAIGLGLAPAGITALPARVREQIATGMSPENAAGVVLDEFRGARKHGADRAGSDKDPDPSSIRGSGKVKYKDKSGRKKEPPGQTKK